MLQLRSIVQGTRLVDENGRDDENGRMMRDLLAMRKETYIGDSCGHNDRFHREFHPMTL